MFRRGMQESLASPLLLRCLRFLLVVVVVLSGGFCCVFKSENWTDQFCPKRREFLVCPPCPPPKHVCR